MAETLKGPAIYNPKTLAEVLLIKAQNPQTMLFAGGTDIMKRDDYYPNPDQPDLINLSGVPEMARVLHSEHYLEVGAMVTVSQLLATGSYFLSKEICHAIENIGSSVIRNQATIGGCLCSQTVRTSLSCYLATIGAQAEVKLVYQKGKKHYNVQTRLVSIMKLYNPDGTLALPQNGILTKVRIPVYEHDIHVFRTVGDINRTPSESLSFGLSYSLSQRKITSPTLFIAFSTGGFFNSASVDDVLASLFLPVSYDNISEISKLVSSELEALCPVVSELQKERAVRLVESVLFELNSRYLEG